MCFYMINTNTGNFRLKANDFAKAQPVIKEPEIRSLGEGNQIKFF